MSGGTIRRHSGMIRCAFLLFAVLHCSLHFAQAPEFAWVRDQKGPGTEQARDIAVDATGNIYVVGSFNSTALTIGSLSLANGGNATNDIFLVKYDRTGLPLWARRAGGSDEDQGVSVSLDGSGNAFICGWFQSSTASFGNVTVNNYTNTGFEDIFVAKYDPAGNVLWARGYGGTQQEYAHSIVTDGTGNCFITGEFFSLSVLFGNFGVINSGASDIYLTKIDGSGTVAWAKRIGGGNVDNARDVAVDGAGNVYLAGYYNSSSIQTFSPALTNAGGFDILYAKYDAAGNNVFAGRFGSAGDESCFAVTATSSGEFFLMGGFDGSTLQFGSATVNNASGSDFFYTKLSASGSVLWATRSGGSQGADRGDLLIDGAGDLYAAGSHNLSAFSFGSLTLGTGGSFDGFAVKVSGSTGAAVWGRTTASAGAEEIFAIARSNAGFVHLAGSYLGTLTLGANNNVAQGADGFVTKLCFPPAAPTSVSSTTVCQGSTGALTAVVPGGTTAHWFSSAAGGAPLGTGASFNAPSPGTYYVASRDTNSGCAMYHPTRLPGTLHTFPSSTIQVGLLGHTLTANGQGSVTAWLNCASGTTLTGQSGASYVLTGSGQFAVIMRNPQGCLDTSACGSYSYVPGSDTVIVTTGLSKRSMKYDFDFYPNPASRKVYITGASAGECGLFNVTGGMVRLVRIEDDGTGVIPLSGLSPGTYLLRNVNSRGAGRLLIISPD
jgi:hypothetical protein